MCKRECDEDKKTRDKRDKSYRELEPDYQDL